MAGVPLVFWNDELVPQSEARLPLHDLGLIQGVTVSDLVRTFNRKLLFLDDHLERFQQSTTLAGVPLRHPLETIARQAQRLVEHNLALLDPGQDIILVMLATPGPSSYYLPTGERRPTLILHTLPFSAARHAPLLTQGVRLLIPTIQQVPASSVDPRIKQRSRIHWWLADQEAQRLLPGASALLPDSQGHLTETSTANFLLVQEGIVLTPPSGTILPGVSLRVTRELCEQLKIVVAERFLNWQDCLKASEAMVCSTPYGLAGVKQISRIQEGKLETMQWNWPGPITRQLSQAWNHKVGINIEKQILSCP